MKKLFKYFVFALAVSLTACGTDEPTDNNGGDNTENPGGDNNDGNKDEKITADFDYSVNKATGAVTFTNKSTGADAYEWSFGDDQDGFSIEKDPVYTYSKPGTYKVNLVASKGTDWAEVSKDVVVEIEKNEVAIKIDGEFDDWTDVPSRKGEFEMEGFTDLKTVATNDYIYVYLEIPTTTLNGAGIINFDIDMDYNYETGFVDNKYFPNEGKSGADVSREAAGGFVWGWRAEDNYVGWDWVEDGTLLEYGPDKEINDNIYKEWKISLIEAQKFLSGNSALTMDLEEEFATEMNKEKVRVFIWIRRNDNWEWVAAAPKRGLEPFDVKIGEYINTAE